MVEVFDHPSDIGVRGIGVNYKDAFEEAARGTFSIMADLSGFVNETEVVINCEAFNMEELFVSFINSLLLEAAVRKIIFIDFKIQSLDQHSLKAAAYGEKIKTIHKGLLKTEVKAATYSELKVTEQKGKFIAQCILDV